jgi:hypothetical protein
MPAEQLQLGTDDAVLGQMGDKLMAERFDIMLHLIDKD